jgi:hypothetical protein
MKALLLAVLVFVPAVFGQDAADDSPLPVLEFKWQRDRREPPARDTSPAAPVRAMTSDDKNFRRKALEQRPPGAIDSNEMTTDGRSAALEKAVQESRTARPKRVDGYTYNAKVKNLYTETAEVVFWEYRFTELANPSNVVKRQFVCAVKIKPDESRDLNAFLLGGPSDVISADSLAGAKEKLFDEKVLIHRIEYANGAVMQRKDWNYAELKPAIDRAVSTPWGKEICRGL